MEVRTIHNDDDLTAALRRIEELWEVGEGSPEDDELDVLTYLVERYEQKQHPIPSASPLIVLKFMMEQSGRTQSDLAALLGSRPRASEILNGKRDLTLEQIRLLHAKWKIPIGALVGELADA